MRVFDHFLRYKKHFVLGPIFKLLEAIFELLLPLLMARIIDEGILNHDLNTITKVGLMMLALTISGYGFSIICQYFASVASQGVGTSLRNALYQKINELTQEQVQHLGSNTLTTRINSDVNQIQLAVAMLIRLAVRAPFIVIGSVVLAGIINLQLTAIFVAVMILIALVLYSTMRKSIPFYRRIQGKIDQLTLVLSENLSGVRVIRAFAAQHRETKRFKEASQDVRQDLIRVGRIAAVMNPLTYLFVNCGILLVLWFGGKQVDGGLLLSGQVVALVNYLTQIFLALVVVANITVIFTRGFASSARVNEILKLQPQFTEGALDVIPSSFTQLEVQDLGFRYQDSHIDFLQHISFTVEEGEILGIIGGTGSGKSTLAYLLNRLYDASCGRILFYGRELKDYRFKTLRDSIGLVMQKNALLSGTLRYNLGLSDPSIDDERMIEALRVAQAYDFVFKDKQGLDAVIEQGGKNLSGGQRQRLCIARTLCKQPRILILDDSFSALDYATDYALRSALRSTYPHMTMVFISQRISSIQYANQILVLDQGKQVSLGTHDELLKASVVYQEIYRSQNGGAEHD